MTTQALPFVPALLIIDIQEDFLPPTGSLSVPDGRSIIPHVEKLLTLPFALKIATKDWHPASHTSFASNHANTQPFTPLTLANPLNAAETMRSTAWPVHCVQGTAGAQFAAELREDLEGRADVRVLYKGMHEDVEMYSAFYDEFRQPRVLGNELGAMLREKGVSHVFVVGLAADYCVRATALHAAEEGFETYVVGEATRAVGEGAVEACRKEIERKGVRFVGMEGEEVKRVVGLK